MPFSLVPPTEVGCPIPANTPHAVSVTLPTWAANVAYEEGKEWVSSKMTSGYPRFYVHSIIQQLSKFLEDKYGRDGEKSFLFPTYAIACRCRDFMKRMSSNNPSIRIIQLSTPQGPESPSASLAAVFFPESEGPYAKAYWQHSGEGVSSRMAEYILEKLAGAEAVSCGHGTGCTQKPGSKCGGYHKPAPPIVATANNDSQQQRPANEKESSVFLEERFGRNLDLSFAKEAKIALRRRISSKINESSHESGCEVSEDDVYLYPTGMTSIFSAHRVALEAGGNFKSVCYGFPYVDTKNILSKFGPGFYFFGMGDESSLAELRTLLESGERILALFCEFPSNPLLKSPDLRSIKELADKYGFYVVVDETIGNILNIHVLPCADMVASSLTKVFSGDSNVMGGSLVLNPKGKHYKLLKETLTKQYEDTFWAEDAIYMERNSRDFADRSARINSTAEAVAELFQSCPLIKSVFYPKLNESRKYFDEFKVPNGGGYGGLLSIVFKNPEHSQIFYDSVVTAKGPSLGTNFTLTSPYAILAHFQELDWAEKFGVDRNLIRISVGLEDKEELLETFRNGLAVCK